MTNEAQPKLYIWAMPAHGAGLFHWQLRAGDTLMACGARLVVKRRAYLGGRPVSATCISCLANWRRTTGRDE